MSKIEQISVADIFADVNQPRKDFDAAKMGNLKNSIDKHGIINPVVVQEQSPGKYLLVDGERRWRAAKLLKLREIPANVRKNTSESDRLIQQFQLQEQHEGWSALEKALAVGRLSKSLGVNLKEMCNLLNLPSSTISDYLAFHQLTAKKSFMRREIPVGLSKWVISIKNYAKKRKFQVEETDMSKEELDALEEAILKRMITGEMAKPGDFTKLRDAITMDVTVVDRFIKTTGSTAKFFLESKAQDAYHFRNTKNSLGFAYSHMRKVAQSDMVRFFQDDAFAREAAKHVHERLGALLKAL